MDAVSAPRIHLINATNSSEQSDAEAQNLAAAKAALRAAMEKAAAEAQAAAAAQAQAAQAPVVADTPTSTDAVNPNTVATKTVAQPTSASVTPTAQSLEQPTSKGSEAEQGAFGPTDGAYQREEFSAQLNTLHPEVFTSAEDVTTTLATLGIEVDPALADAIFETSKSQVYTPGSSTGFTEGFTTSALESLIFDQGSASTPGQTTPGALGLVANTQGAAPLRLELDANASGFDKLRFGWTGSADAATLISRLQMAGYGVDAPSDNSSALTLSQDDQNALEWLANARGYRDASVSHDKVLSWGEISSLVTLGVLELEPGASPQEGVVDMDAAIHLALAGGKYSREFPPLGDLDSNPAVVDDAYRMPFFDEVFADDNQFSQALKQLGLTVDPTQLGLYRSAHPSDATTGPGTLSVQQLDAAISAGTYQYSLTDDGRLLVSLADPNAVLKDAIAAAPELANAQSLTAEQLVSVMNGLTGTQRGDLSAEDAQFMVTQFGDAATGRINAQQLQGAVDFGALQAAVDPADNSIEIVVNKPAPPEVGTDPGTSATGTVTATVSAAGIRTPVPNGGGLDNVWNKNLLPSDVTNLSQFAARYNATDGAFDVGAFSFRGKTRADGQFEVEMAVRGSQAPQWSTVFTGDGDSVVKGLQTYEWDVGATGSATWKPGESGSDPSGSLGEYSRLKPFNTFWVFEKDQGDSTINAKNDLDNKSFRVRTYFPFPVFTEGAGSTDGQAGGSLSGNYWVDLRWGRMDGPPAPTNPGRLVEWGVNLNLGVSGAGNLIQDAIAGDWAAVGQDAISLPKAGVNFGLWQFGLFGVKAAAAQVADQILGRQPDDNADGLLNDTGSRWYRTVPSNIVRYIGDTLQHWGLVGTLGAQVFAQPNPGTSGQSSSASTTQTSSQSALPDGLPPEFASLFAGFEGMAQPLDGVFDALENIDLSKLNAVAQGASAAIEAFATAKEFIQAFKSRGASLFKNLDDDGKTKLLDLVMEEATRLMLEQSGMGPPSVLPDSTAPAMLSADQQQKSLLMLPGETAAQYATRLGENIAANMGQAVKNVMLNEETWNDLQPHWNSPENSNPGDTGGESSGGQGGGVGGGVGAAAGSGVAGALAGAAGAVAGAIATVGALIDSVNNDPTSGNNDALNAALDQAQDVLTDAQALLKLITEGGSNAGVGSITDMQQRCKDAVAALQSAVAQSPTASDDIKSKVNGEVIPALQSVDASLQALLDDSGELSDSALNNMLGWPDGAAQQLPDDVVDQLMAADPAAVSALWAGGLPPELIVRVLPELLPGDLEVPGFVPVLVADLQSAMASAGTAGTADSVTDAQITDAVVHARYQDLITAEQYSDPLVRQDLAAAQTRFAVPLIRDALERGYSPAEVVTAQSSEDLQYVLDSAPVTDDGEVLFQEFQAAMDRGWTLSEIAKVAHLVEGYPTPPIDDSQAGPEGLGSSRPFIAKALHLLHLDEVRDEAFMSQLQRTYNALDPVQVGSSMGPIQLPIEWAIINTRYQGYATQDELDDPRFFEALYHADTSLHITDRQAAVDYARAAVAPSEPPAPAAPQGLTVSVNGQSFEIADPALVSQIQDAASRGDFATVANLIGPVVVQGEYGEGPNFTLPLTPDGVPIYLPGPTQENDGTTFENASGATIAADGGNDYTLSFDHESFIFDIDAGPIADSVHYDVSLDFHYSGPG